MNNITSGEYGKYYDELYTNRFFFKNLVNCILTKNF